MQPFQESPRSHLKEHKKDIGRLEGDLAGLSQLGRAGEGIRTLDVNLGKVALYH